MDRRSFVRTCVAAGGAVALGAAGFGMTRATLEPRAGPYADGVWYPAARRVGGPAPRGVPYIPLMMKDGVFQVRTRLEGGRFTPDALAWHRYCGRSSHPGLEAGWTGDDVLRYHVREELLRYIQPWYGHLLGEPVRPEHFPGPGFGAPFVWRPTDAEDESRQLTGVLVLVDEEEIQRPTDEDLGRDPSARELYLREFDLVRRDVFHGGFIAASSVCTHFCATAGYREAPSIARPRNAWDRIFCTSHNASFEPRMPVLSWMAPEPGPGWRPERAAPPWKPL